MKIKKGDNVIIITGKDKGKKGKIVHVLARENKVIIEGAKHDEKAPASEKVR